MTADEIREMDVVNESGSGNCTNRILREIAAQLAELNAQLKRWDTAEGESSVSTMAYSE